MARDLVTILVLLFVLLYLFDINRVDLDRVDRVQNLGQGFKNCIISD